MAMDCSRLFSAHCALSLWLCWSSVARTWPTNSDLLSAELQTKGKPVPQQVVCTVVLPFMELLLSCGKGVQLTNRTKDAERCVSLQCLLLKFAVQCLCIGTSGQPLVESFKAPQGRDCVDCYVNCAVIPWLSSVSICWMDRSKLALFCEEKRVLLWVTARVKSSS